MSTGVFDSAQGEHHQCGPFDTRLMVYHSHALSGLVQFYGLRGKDGFHRTEHTFTRAIPVF